MIIFGVAKVRILPDFNYLMEIDFGQLG